MHIHAHSDIEWTASAAQIASIINQPDWSLLRRNWLDHAWQIETAHDATAWRWIAHTLDRTRRWALTLMLLPNETSTHVRAHLMLEEPHDSFAMLRQWRRSRWLDRELRQALEHWSHDLAMQTAGSSLDERYPLTMAAFRSMNAAADLARIQQLEQRWRTFEHGAQPALQHSISATLPQTEHEFDLVYAGGGLGLIHATLMAQKGYKVLVFDRYAVGCAHREWNISRDELERLVQTGFISWETLNRDIIMRQYRDGIVRFHADGSYVPAAELHLPAVLDIALDANALLQYARAQFLAVGGTIWENASFEHVTTHATELGKTLVTVCHDDQTVHVATRLMLDAMGATSPLTLATQPFSGICPTVGTVLEGADYDPDLGDILISVADTQRGRQLIWEGFPGRGDELTVYVFYYDRVGANAQHDHSLLDLFEDYFRLLPSYKPLNADFRHLRPVYGYIPARHALRRPLPLRGVYPLGDASAQQSPLTFCGFGSFVRNLERTTSLLDYAITHHLLEPEHLQHISAYQANVSLNWVFSRFMSPFRTPHSVNELQNVFARVLNDLGYNVARRFFQDQMTWRDYRTILTQTLRVYPAIIPITIRTLGWRDTWRWFVDWLRFSRTAALATIFKRFMPSIIPMLEDRHPAVAFRLKAWLAEWQAMGWMQKKAESRKQKAEK